MNVAYGVCASAFGQALVTELGRATGSLLRSWDVRRVLCSVEDTLEKR